MKRALVIATLVFVMMASALSAVAQRKYRLEMKPQRPPGTNFGRHYEDVEYPTPEKRAANLTELLALTDDQKAKVQAIFVNQDKQSAALWADESLTPEMRTRKLAEVRDGVTRTVRDLLTDDQKKKYDAVVTDGKPAEKVRLQPDPKA